MFRSLFCLLLLVSASLASALTGVCTRVQDGDTFKMDNGTTIRLYAIDAPEKDQPFGDESRDALRSLIQGREVELEVMTEDRYNRSVAKVYCNGVYINLKMVRDGCAWYYAYFADPVADAALDDAQKAAKAAKRGLWAQPAVNPYVWRKQHGTVHSRREEATEEAPQPEPSTTTHFSSLSGVCTHVQDGDSFKLDNGTTVRLYAIDAPEKDQPFGDKARNTLRSLIQGREVELEVMTEDNYDRSVAKVYCNGVYINLKMVRDGLAWYSAWRGFEPENDIAAAHRDAEAAKRGLWAQSAVNPYVWRKQHGTVHSRREEAGEEDTQSAPTRRQKRTEKRKRR